jgi:hypothetical protein
VPSSAQALPRLGRASTGRSSSSPGPRVELHTAAAWRGNTALDVDLVAAEATPELATLVRASMVETVQRAAGGVEQSWRFERAAGTDGELVIAVAATGLAYVGADAAGLLLVHPGLLDVRHGHGTWIDANGTRWAIPARYDRGRIFARRAGRGARRVVVPGGARSPDRDHADRRVNPSPRREPPPSSSPAAGRSLALTPWRSRSALRRSGPRESAAAAR